MARLFVMCGLQGSGKSTKAKEIQTLYGMGCSVILSSDEIRKEMPMADNSLIFKTLYARMNTHLENNKCVIVDATNITIKSRQQILNAIKHPCEKACYIVNTPYNICLERVRQRNKNPNSHYVPEDVLEKYYHSFEIPFYEEGWDEITVDYHPNRGHSTLYLNKLTEWASTFNQNNKHHTQLLRDHMNTVEKYLSNVPATKDILCLAGKYHDVGKLFTQTYKEGDPNAHYYDHANVGTYEILCHAGYTDSDWCDYNSRKTLDWLFYINYHMKMHDIKTEKSIKKWNKIFGDYKFKHLTYLNKADCFRGTDEELIEQAKSLRVSVNNNESSVKFFTLPEDRASDYWQTVRQGTFTTINPLYYETITPTAVHWEVDDGV